MPRRLLPVLLGVALFAVGCSTTPVAWVPPPIPARPVFRTPAQPPPVQEVTPATPRAPLVSPDLAVAPRETWANKPPNTRLLDPMGRPTCITVHHEGDMAQLASTGEVRLHLMKMQAVHMKPKGEDGLGAADIAYHFLIDPSGRVIEGRKLAWQGAHAGNNDANRGNIGICLLGNFDVQRPTEAQKQALRKLLVTLMNRYNIPVSRVYTHCEVKRKFALAATDCPGKNLQVYVDGLRSSLRYASR